MPLPTASCSSGHRWRGLVLKPLPCIKGLSQNPRLKHKCPWGGRAWMQPQRAGSDGCWLPAGNVQAICSAAPAPARCPNLGNPWDLQRASACFKNTLFFRKYSVQYSVLCSPSFNPLPPPPHCLLPLHRGQGNVGTSAGAAGKPRAGFTDPASIFPGRWAALEPLLVPSSKVLSHQNPQ